MTRKEELQELKAMTDFFVAMSDNDFFDYLYKNSPSFRRDWDTIKSDPTPIITDADISSTMENISYTKSIEIFDDGQQFVATGDLLCQTAA